MSELPSITIEEIYEIVKERNDLRQQLAETADKLYEARMLSRSMLVYGRKSYFHKDTCEFWVNRFPWLLEDGK